MSPWIYALLALLAVVAAIWWALESEWTDWDCGDLTGLADPDDDLDDQETPR